MMMTRRKPRRTPPPIRTTHAPAPELPRAAPGDAYQQEPARIEPTIRPAVADGPTCVVCGQRLIYGPSVAGGVCARRDAAHASARRDSPAPGATTDATDAPPTWKPLRLAHSAPNDWKHHE